ncbi:MAG: bifunctional 5,10-methylenetetrahydrofolate dehydrogenase/5,10-methenyltetrahydrofolate cyclohydrolase, partial [Proteobacteria bacterium]|nr:bifunctional 5,10-methylenetetrahydrofolate dehydrogenase/5,10-methenyltetrahydrofolate cyclohydrolase [Pseudomonadota bacterium]
MFLLDGKALSLKEQEQLKNRISNLAIKPSLHVILVGCLAPSEIYVEKKQHAATYVGIQSFVHRFTNETTTEELLKFIHTLNNDASVHAILLQLPLPHHLDSRTIIDAISPLKDVDGLTSSNLGKLMLGSPQIIPCTPQGCLDLIRRCNQNIEGLH